MSKLIKWSDGKKGLRWGYHIQAALRATWLFVGLRTHTHTHTRAPQTWHLRITEQTAALCLKVCQSRERIKSSVWAKPYRQSVKHNRGCEEGHSLSLFLFSFSLSQPLFFHKECVSHIVRCVSISNCSDGWRWTDRKEEWDGNLVSQREEKERFITIPLRLFQNCDMGEGKLLLNLHTLWKMKLVLIYKTALFLMKINSLGMFVFLI